MMLETHMKLHVTARFLFKKFFCQKNVENVSRMRQKSGFLNLFKKYCHLSIISIMKFFIIWYIPVLISYLEKV